MSVDEWAVAEAILADPSTGIEEQAGALITLTLAAWEFPDRIDPSMILLCEQLLRSPLLSPKLLDHILMFLAQLIYWRSELVGTPAVSGLAALFAGPPVSDLAYDHIHKVLNFLLATPGAADALDLLRNLLARPNLAPAAYDALLQSLEYAASWQIARLDLAALVGLAAGLQLVSERQRLFDRVVERAMLADPAAVTAQLLERLQRLYEGQPCFTYCLAYLAYQAAVSSEVREMTEAAIIGHFPLRARIAHQLGSGKTRVLVIQNIQDRQGDEIIRVVPLLEALLCFNPLLEVVLVTGRTYLYTHSRIRLVPVDDQASIQAIFSESFDTVIDFFEPVVPQVNYDLELERQVQAYIEAHAPFLYLASAKGSNHFVYHRVDIQSQPYAETLRLNRQRVANIYETTFRLIAELGLPLRFGEEPPPADAVLAGLPCPDAEAAWTALLARNTSHCPVALVCPFGGVEPLKGYVERQASSLAARLHDLIAEGFYVVLLPNGMPWGSTKHAQAVVSLLEPQEQAQLVIAPDPIDGTGQVHYEWFGAHTVPHASYMMRLVTYYVRFAGVIVTVEGWMVHAAYCLGKRTRILMLPYSHPAEWHPYGRTLEQDVVLNRPPVEGVPPLEDASGPPLPEQPRKFVLLFVLESLALSDDPRAVPLLHWALRSEDRDVRMAATAALGHFSGPDIDSSLWGLLEDPATRVRAVAAGVLLERPGGIHAGRDQDQRPHLLANQWIGQQPSDWAQVIGLGEGARHALQVATRDDDVVVAREASQVLQFLDHRQARARGMEHTAGRDVKQVVHTLGRAAQQGSRIIRALVNHVPHPAAERASSALARPTVLILTPVKDAADCLDGYCERLHRLTYPHDLISLGFLESDSSDTTYGDLRRRLPALQDEFRRAALWKKDFGFHIPPELPRWAPQIQVERRGVLAKSRNHLLFHALDDEMWVLWLDVDVVVYPTDLIERLLSTGKELVQPHCVLDYGGRTFDRNGWRDYGRLHLDDLRSEGELVELDAVGGTVLLVRADLHRDGLVYPAFLYGLANPWIRTGLRSDFEGEIDGEIETEGLGMMARDMGYRCWGMPHLEVIHRRK